MTPDTQAKLKEIRERCTRTEIGSGGYYLRIADFKYIFDLIEKLLKEKEHCKHPGCACVCAHEGKCPEDGPSLIGEDVCD